MSREERTALKNDAVAFVQEIVTEVYGQRPSKKVVSTAAKGVVEALLPAKLAAQQLMAAKERHKPSEGI